MVANARTAPTWRQPCEAGEAIDARDETAVRAFIAGLGVFFGGRSPHERRDVWLTYARWLIAGLTFQLAADIIETSIRSSWESIAQLGVVAVIRTFLNYFLERDLAEVRDLQRQTGTPGTKGE